MGRQKNADRQHLIADYNGGEVPEDSEFHALAQWITEITDASEEGTEEFGYYDGDGTPQIEVLTYREGYEVTGTYDPTNEAQSLVASKKRTLGTDRYVWHKIISADGNSEVIGVATLSGIVAGAGEATAYEEFKCTITFNEIAREVNAENVDNADDVDDVPSA